MSKATSTGTYSVRRQVGMDAPAPQPPAPQNQPTLLFYFFASVGIILGVLVIIASIVFFVGSFVMVGVLNDITGVHDYSAPMGRIKEYEGFFDGISKSKQFVVTSEEPKIDQGITYYLWQVKPRDRDDFLAFRWRHDLKTNEVLPENNAALLLDIVLGNLTEQQARSDFEFYDENDPLAEAVVRNNLNLLGTSSNGAGWVDGQLAELAPITGPVITPEEARKRRFAGAPVEEKEEEELPAETAPGDETADGDATQVGETPTDPPSDGEGEETPPDETTPGDGEQVQPGDTPPDEDAGGDEEDGGDQGGDEEPEDSIDVR